jgi:uncharacterized membrane protein
MVLSASPAVIALERSAVLYHGDALEQDLTSLLLDSDPMLKVTRVPSHAWRSDYDSKTIRRFLRLYMPRRYSDLVEYDLIILSDASSTVFSSGDLAWFRSAVDEKVSLAMFGGHDSFGGAVGAAGWGRTTLEEVLPVDLTPRTAGNIEVKISVVDRENPLMVAVQRLVPPSFMGMNIVEEKQGSSLLATGVSAQGEHPLIVFWDLDASRVLAHTSDWNGGWGANFLIWSEYPIYASLVTYFSARIEIPMDLAVYSELRNLFFDYPTWKGLVISLMEFVEKFGVSSAAEFSTVEEIDLIKVEAEELFLAREYEGALANLNEAKKAYEALSRDMVALKSRALMWVYLIEWMVLTGASIVAGSILWTLMVRRRLYREVGITRAR